MTCPNCNFCVSKFEAKTLVGIGIGALESWPIVAGIS